MMSRLEKIEEMEREVSNGFAIEDLDLNFMTIVGRENIDWLIKQAERVKELEEENAGLHDILEQVEYQEKDKLLAENKRYKKALEFYAKEENHNYWEDIREGEEFVKLPISESDKGFRARQVLKGESE